MNFHPITSLANPSNAQDAATKFYVDNASATETTNLNNEITARQAADQNETQARMAGDVNLQGQINTKANDNAVVHLANTETITGAKTFTSNVNLATNGGGTNNIGNAGNATTNNIGNQSAGTNSVNNIANEWGGGTMTNVIANAQGFQSVVNNYIGRNDENGTSTVNNNIGTNTWGGNALVNNVIGGGATSTAISGNTWGVTSGGAASFASVAGNGSGLTNVTPSSAAGGSLAGTYPNPSIAHTAAAEADIAAAIGAGGVSIINYGIALGINDIQIHANGGANGITFAPNGGAGPNDIVGSGNTWNVTTGGVGTFAAMNVNSGLNIVGGNLLTNGASRLDGSGNLFNIGNISMSGSLATVTNVDVVNPGAIAQYGDVRISRSGSGTMGGSLTLRNSASAAANNSAALEFDVDNTNVLSATGAPQANAEIRAVNTNGTSNATDLVFTNWNGGAEQEVARFGATGLATFGTVPSSHALRLTSNGITQINETDVVGSSMPVTIASATTTSTYNGGTTLGRALRISNTLDATTTRFYDQGVDLAGNFFITQQQSTAQGLTLSPTGTLTVAGNLDMTNGQIVNVVTPTNGTDAANKQYVDNAISTAGGLAHLTGTETFTGAKTFAAITTMGTQTPDPIGASADTRLRLVATGGNHDTYDYGVVNNGDLGYVESNYDNFGYYLDADNNVGTANFTISRGASHTGSPFQMMHLDGSGNMTVAGTGTFAAMVINSGLNIAGGNLLTNGASRLDGSGNLLNIGNVSLSGSIGTATNITLSGDINYGTSLSNKLVLWDGSNDKYTIGINASHMDLAGGTSGAHVALGYNSYPGGTQTFNDVLDVSGGGVSIAGSTGITGPLTVTRNMGTVGDGTYYGTISSISTTTVDVVNTVGLYGSSSGTDDVSTGVQGVGSGTGGGLTIGGDFSANNVSSQGTAVGIRASATGATNNIAVEATNGDVYVTDSSKGIILKDSNGNCHRITVNTSGGLVSTPIACPN